MSTFARNALLLFSGIGLISSSQAKDTTDIQQHINAGEYGEIIEFCKDKKENKYRFIHALSELSVSLEDLHQSLYTYGFGYENRMIGLDLIQPLSVNPNPEQVSYKKLRAQVEKFHESLHKVEEILKHADEGDFSLALDLTKMRFDVDQDGNYSNNETSMSIVISLMGTNNRRGVQEVDGTLDFDKSDLLWLRGYTQVLLGATDLILAHDFERPFAMVASTLFAIPPTEFQEMKLPSGNFEDLVHFIAMFHKLQMKVIEPDRLKESHQHLLNMTRESRIMWKSILAETDNQREFLPSPKQTSAIGIEITDEMVKEWDVFLTEYEDILTGKKLLPHWQIKDKGINLKKVFYNAKETDVILWITGHSAIPFLEKGEMTSAVTWRRINNTFNGNFIVMSFIIN